MIKLLYLIVLIYFVLFSSFFSEFCGVQTPDSSPHGSPFNNTDRLNYHAQLNGQNQPTSAGHLLGQQLQHLNHSQQQLHQDNQIQQLHNQSQPNQQQNNILGQQLHQSSILNNCTSPHSTYNGSTGNQQVPNNLMDATRSLPTPEMSPPENVNVNEKEHYLHLYGHQTTNRFNQNSINVQNSLNSQTGSTQLYQLINNQTARHSPGALSTSSVCSTNNNSTNNSSVYSISSSSTEPTSRSSNDNPVTELISKFSPSSSTFLKNVCPPFQRSTPQTTSPTSPNYDQQLHNRSIYCQPIMDQNQMYSAKRTAYTYTTNVENGQLTWSVYDQQQPHQAYTIYKQEMNKQNENYGSDQLIGSNNNNDLYADYYAEQQQQYAVQEQIMNPNDYLHSSGHLLQAQHAIQPHQLQNGSQFQQITMMQQYGREDSSFINALTEAQETISS